jgi:glutaredoxin 3
MCSLQKAVLSNLKRIFSVRSTDPQTMSNVKSFVDSAIKQYKVVGFSKTYCPYCKKAKDALQSFNYKDGAFQWIEIEERKDCEEIQDYLKELTGGR